MGLRTLRHLVECPDDVELIASLQIDIFIVRYENVINHELDVSLIFVPLEPWHEKAAPMSLSANRL